MQGSSSEQPLVPTQSIFVALSLCIVCIQIDMFAINASLFRMAQDFNVSLHEMKWAVTSYLIGVGVLMYPSGLVSDYFGHDRTCLFGVSLFLIATLLCALAASVNQFVVFRFLQGGAAGVIVSSGIALLTTYYNDFRRKIALVATIGSFSMALGPVIGSLFSTYLSWRFIFVFCIPLIGIAVAIFYLYLDVGKKYRTTLRFPLLVGSTILSLLIAFVSVTLDSPLGSQKFMLLSGASLFLFCVVGYHQFLGAYPVLDRQLVHQRKYLVLTFLGSISNVALLAVIYLFPLSLQDYWGY